MVRCFSGVVRTEIMPILTTSSIYKSDISGSSVGKRKAAHDSQIVEAPQRRIAPRDTPTQSNPPEGSVREVQTNRPADVSITGIAYPTPTRNLPSDGEGRWKDSLGITSFASLIDEHQQEFGSPLSDGENPRPEDRMNTELAVDIGSKVLTYLPDETASCRFIEQYFKCYHMLDPVLHEPTSRMLLDWSWQILRGVHAGPEPKRIALMRIIANQNNPPLIPSANAAPDRSVQALGHAFSGGSLRWETVAFLFVVLGLSGLTLTEWDSTWQTLPEKPSRKSFAMRMLTCSDECLRLVLPYVGWRYKCHMLFSASCVARLEHCPRRCCKLIRVRCMDQTLV